MEFRVRGRSVAALLAFALALAGCAVPGPGGVRYRIVDGGVPAPIASPGDPERGARLAYSREAACILCHQLPPRAVGEPAPLGGDIGPPLAGSGARRKAAELRLRMIDSLRVNPDSVMPAYFRTEGLRRVAAQYGDRPVLQAQQIEDVVAWLATLK